MPNSQTRPAGGETEPGVPRHRRLAPAALADGQRLRLLSYNIQAGIAHGHYGHYLTRSWRYVMPNAGRWSNLDAIAGRLDGYDLVALQETDSGSLRTGFKNQTQYLAQLADIPYWFDQTNRRLGALTRHSNGLLSRFRPYRVAPHRLPGPPGRGALVALLGPVSRPLVVVVAHLALSRRTRLRQMAYLAGVVNGHEDVILMGDLNCDPHSAEMRLLTEGTALAAPDTIEGTFPSWRPRRRIDHILVTPGIRVERAWVPRWTYSDHLPIAMEVVVPDWR